MCVAQDNDVVHTFTPDRSDQPFDKAIDGTHRLAAFSALQLMPQHKFADLGLTKPALEQDVWMGER
jgi:hypothetical protein